MSDSVYQTPTIPQLPNEIILMIIEAAATSDLLYLSRTCSSFRQLTIPIYLRRLRIIKTDDRGAVRLAGNIPAKVISLLCSTMSFDKMDLTCDLSFILGHWQKLAYLLARVPTVYSIRVIFYHRDLLFMGRRKAKIERTLSSFLASLSGRHCKSFAIEQRYVPLGQHLCGHSFSAVKPAKAVRRQVEIGVSTIETLEVSTALFKALPLARWCLGILESPSITSLSLFDNCRLGSMVMNDILPEFDLPSLRSLEIHGVLSMVDLATFLSRHKQVCELKLIGSAPMLDFVSCGDMPISDITMSAYILPPLMSSFTLSSLSSLSILLPVEPTASFPALNDTLSILAGYRRLDAIKLGIRFNNALATCLSSRAESVNGVDVSWNEMPAHHLYPLRQLSGLREVSIGLWTGLDVPGLVSAFFALRDYN
jgi:hypothetical protein